MFLLHGWLFHLDEVEIDVICPLAPPDRVDEVSFFTWLAIGCLERGVALGRGQYAPDDVSLRFCSEPLAVLTTWSHIHQVGAGESALDKLRIVDRAECWGNDWHSLIYLCHFGLSVAVDSLHRGVFVCNTFKIICLGLKWCDIRAMVLDFLLRLAGDL